MNVIDKIQKDQMDKIIAERAIPDFSAGDTIKVDVKIVEGDKERIQAFEGLCICLLYTSPSPRDRTRSRMPSSA